MTRALSTLLLAALFATGCPTRAKNQADSKDAGPHADASSLTVTLQITSPNDGTYVNGKVSLTVVANVAQASVTISLLDGQNLLANVVGPTPYKYVWDTTPATEGPHQIFAQTIANGRSVTSSPITINVDHTAPTVTATTPASGATNVVLNAPITATFSEPIVAASLTASGAVTLTVGGKAAPATVSVSNDGKTVTIVPTSLASVGLPASFGVSFASSITDLAGNTLVAPTPGWSWTIPEWFAYPALTTMTGSITPKLGNPHLAITRDLRPALAYTDAYIDVGGTQRYAALEVELFDGAAWRSLGSPSTTSLPNDQLGHFLALDSSDHPIVVWSATSPTASSSPTHADSVYLAVWDGTSWGAASPPLNGNIGQQSIAIKPVVRVDSSDRPVVGWIEQVDSTMSPGDAFLTTWAGTQWDETRPRVGLGTPSSIDVSADGAGNPVLGWLDTGNAGFSTWNGNVWTKSPPLGDAPPLAGRPTVVFDSEADPLMVTTEALPPFSVQRLIANTWQLLIQSPTTATPTSATPLLAVAPNHNFALAWSDLPGKVTVARRTSGNQWDLRAPSITSTTGFINSDFDFVVDAEGGAWVAWDDGKTMNVWMSNYPLLP